MRAGPWATYDDTKTVAAPTPEQQAILESWKPAEKKAAEAAAAAAAKGEAPQAPPTEFKDESSILHSALACMQLLCLF